MSRSNAAIASNRSFTRSMRSARRTGRRSTPARLPPTALNAALTSAMGRPLRHWMTTQPAGTDLQDEHPVEGILSAPPLSATSVVTEICREIRARQRFLLTSHARPDGDSLGSQLAMAFALDALGKEVRIVNADAAPDHYLALPGMKRIEIAGDAPETFRP